MTAATFRHVSHVIRVSVSQNHNAWAIQFDYSFSIISTIPFNLILKIKR